MGHIAHLRNQLKSMNTFGPLVLEKKIFFKFVNVFPLFRNYLPLEKGGTLHLKKLEFPSPKNALWQICSLVLEKKIFNF